MVNSQANSESRKSLDLEQDKLGEASLGTGGIWLGRGWAG